MKALTLTQPWATLVAVGAKRIETRSWSTLYRGELAIHAAKGMTREDASIAGTEPFARYLNGRGFDLPRGAILATARLVACEPTIVWSAGSTFGAPGSLFGERGEWVPSPQIPRGSDELAFGDFSRGRFMWILEDVIALPEPVPARGSLGLGVDAVSAQHYWIVYGRDAQGESFEVLEAVGPMFRGKPPHDCAKVGCGS